MSFRKPMQVTRTLAGSYVNGVFVNGSQTTIDIEATVQPMKSEDMVTLPEGRRLSDFIKMYTSTNLNTVSEITGQQPDRFEWRGNTYECLSVEVNQMDVIPHYKCIFVKVSQ